MKSESGATEKLITNNNVSRDLQLQKPVTMSMNALAKRCMRRSCSVALSGRMVIFTITSGGILSLTDATDSHHYHHGQKPTMVGISHGENEQVNHDDFDDDF